MAETGVTVFVKSRTREFPRSVTLLSGEPVRCSCPAWHWRRAQCAHMRAASAIDWQATLRGQHG